MNTPQSLLPHYLTTFSCPFALEVIHICCSKAGSSTSSAKPCAPLSPPRGLAGAGSVDPRVHLPAGGRFARQSAPPTGHLNTDSRQGFPTSARTGVARCGGGGALGPPRTAPPASAALDGGKRLMWKGGGSITRASTRRACSEPRRGDRLGMPGRAEPGGKRGAARWGRGLLLWWALRARGGSTGG